MQFGDMPPTGQNCGKCRFFRPTHMDPGGIAGYCCFMPVVIEKKKIEWCGQYQKRLRSLRFTIGRAQPNLDRSYHVIAWLGIFWRVCIERT